MRVICVFYATTDAEICINSHLQRRTLPIPPGKAILWPCSLRFYFVDPTTQHLRPLSILLCAVYLGPISRSLVCLFPLFM